MKKTQNRIIGNLYAIFTKFRCLNMQKNKDSIREIQMRRV